MPSILHLFHDPPSGSDSDNPKDNDCGGHKYTVLAVPKNIPVPYKLRSGKTTTTQVVPGSTTDREMVACPYLAQASWAPVWVKSLTEADELAEAIFQNVQLFLWGSCPPVPKVCPGS
ncbi:hypothetical protein DSO57_1026594 [Entomophthora muscae]|uniref:Uncharacterized protein n=1 Tax=Entomophthora muscae TaxID=34485 RepID=A0ACC2RSX2_9FUNG|nr:hypothetical protein DSO57_1026594 [Entomophthora muscae]